MLTEAIAGDRVKLDYFKQIAWPMFRVFTILALTFTQLLSLGTGPLYLCIGEDGSVCLDANPETCTCCESCSESESADESEESCCSCGHAHESNKTLPIANITETDDCRCTHFLLSSGQSMPVVSDCDHVRHLTNVTSLCLPVLSLDGASSAERQVAPVMSGEPPSYALLSLSCVVLRC